MSGAGILASEGVEQSKNQELFAKTTKAEKIVFENANSIMLFDSKGSLVKAEKFEAPTNLEKVEIKIDSTDHKILSAYIEFDTGATKMLKVKLEQ
jgi:hypothetical protein